PGAIAEAQRRAEAAERAQREAVERASENADLLRRTVLTIPHAAGEDGRLFGSVTAQEIVDAIAQARGIRIDRRKVQLEQPIRSTGTYMVNVEVQDGVSADVKTIVTPA
ncbi:MAG: 50S ribosomal protein L9, partial [Actinomycetota bacterium]|nr:50S ribosomal protein L9 [Actinomycetota bacterium]